MIFLNTAGGIQGVMEIMPFLEEEEVEEFQREGPLSFKNSFVAEIRTQRDLKAAEQGNLLVHIKELSVSDILSSIQALYKHHRVSKRKNTLKICNISNAEKNRKQMKSFSQEYSVILLKMLLKHQIKGK